MDDLHSLQPAIQPKYNPIKEMSGMREEDMRRRARVDLNQPCIVATLRKLGASVAHTHTVSQGFPDIAIGYRGATYLAEIKDGTLSPSRRELTVDEERFHKDWRGHVVILQSIEDAVKFIHEKARLA